MSSIRAKLIRGISAAILRRYDAQSLDIERVRRQTELLGKLQLTAFGVSVDKDTVNGLHAEWLRPKHRIDGKLLLYLHGGAYIVGGCDMHRHLVSHIARAARIQALVPEYRLAPEHKFPAAVDDAVAVYLSVLRMGIKACDVIVAGDSAGGGLAVAMLLSLRDAGVALPAAAVLLSPFLDATGSGASMRTRAELDPWFKAEQLPVISGHYCEAHQQRFPLVSPVFADVEGLPPMLIQVGDHEILLSDSERFTDLLIAAGSDVQLEVWPEMFHVFQMFVGKMPEARQAIKAMGDYIQSRFS